MGKQWKQWQTLFFWAPKSLQMVTAAMKLKDAYSYPLTTKKRNPVLTPEHAYFFLICKSDVFPFFPGGLNGLFPACLSPVSESPSLPRTQTCRLRPQEGHRAQLRCAATARKTRTTSEDRAGRAATHSSRVLRTLRHF